MWATCPKTWNGGKKQAFLAAQIGGGQKWALHLFRLKSIFYKNAKKQNFLPFLNSYYYQNCRRADSFQHLYIKNARKRYKVLIIRGNGWGLPAFLSTFIRNVPIGWQNGSMAKYLPICIKTFYFLNGFNNSARYRGAPSIQKKMPNFAIEI